MARALLTLQQLWEQAAATAAWRALSRRPALIGALALVLLSTFAYRALFGGGMILTADTLHAIRIFEMDRCLNDGQIPCRWAPDMGNGYGFPLFNYYPPLPYYVGDLLHRLGLSYLRAVDALYVLGLVGAGLAMFALARRLWGDLGGLVSATAYVYAPYLALDVYMRGALTELWALALAPALFWAVYELVTTSRPRFVPLVAVFLALLLLSHNLVAVIVAPALALWTAVLLLTRGREGWRPALLGAAGAIWGFGLAAFFTLPVLMEGDLVQLDSLAETLRQTELLYPSNFVTVRDLFLLRTADYSFLLGAGEDTPIQIGWFHWAVAGLSAPAGVFLLRRGQRTAALAIAMFVVFFGVGVFMAVSRSQFIWDSFDALRFLQFPWRYLGLVSLASAGLAGAWLALLRDRPLWAQWLVAATLVGLFIGAGQALFQPLHRCTVTVDRPIDCPGSDAEYFSDTYFPQRGSIQDYLPIAVERIPLQPPEELAKVVAGAAIVRSATAGTDWLQLELHVTREARVEAALFDYPNWRVRVDGETVPHVASEPNGLVTFLVPAGATEVDIRLEDTGIRRLGNWLSLVSLAALALTPPAMLLAPWLRRRLIRLRAGQPGAD
jgi:hypothetical protein